MAINIDINDKKTQIGIGILAAGIIAAGAIFYMQIMPRTEELRRLEEQSAQLQRELDRIVALRPQLERMRVEVARLQVEMDSLEALFPIDPDVPGLITAITKVARAKQVGIMNFRPVEVIRREYYVENHYEMSVLGSYHRIGSFFAHIANFDLLVNIDRVSVRASSVLANDLQNFDAYRGARSSDDMIRSVLTSFRIVTYSSLEGGGNGQ